MTSLVCLVTSYFVNAVWEVAVIGGTGVLVSRSLKRLGPGVQHSVWVAALTLAIVTPLFPLWRLLGGLACASATVNGHFLIAAVAAAATEPTIRSSSIVLLPALIQGIALLYLGAVLYFAARLGWLLRRTSTFVREAEPVSLGPEDEEVWNRSKRAFSVQNAFMLSSQRLSGPVTAGLIRPVLLVPEGFFDKCTSHDFLAALAHECAHMKRRDFGKNLLYEIEGLFIAFHPVTWMIKSRIAETREMICDRMATEIVDAQTYTRSLLRLVAMIPFSAPTRGYNGIGIFDADILEKRITMISSTEQHLSSTLRNGLTISGLYSFSLWLVAVGQ